MALCTPAVVSSLNEINERASTFTASQAEADRLAALKAAQELIRKLQTPEESLLDIVYGPTHALCIRVGVDLDVFNTLSSREGPVTLEEVAAVKKADPVLVERVLRVLSGIRYVDQVGPKEYSANSMTKEMTSRFAVAKSKFIWHGMPILSKTAEFLKQTEFKNPDGSTGGPFRYAENQSSNIWEWIGEDAERSNDFNTYMEGARGSRPSWLEWFPVKERIIDGFDASQGDILLVDVAGGRGHDTQSFRLKFPSAPGRLVVEDQPRVIEDIHELDQSIERIGFDLFKKQPVENARTYYLKFILHDWSDDDCQKILSNISAVMKKGYSKLIIEEFVLDDVNCEILSATMDWEMMIFCNSMERTKGHWQRLLETAGFSVIKFWSPPGNGQESLRRNSSNRVLGCTLY